MLDREMPTLHWSRLFRALRLMELGGEVVAGSFIQGVDVPQFALRSALTEIANPEPAGIYWMSAIDPVSPCGLGLDHAYPELPARIASNHLVFRDGKLVMTSQRHGADLSLHIAPDDPDLRQILAPLFAMAGRSWNPRTRVSIETVNGVAVRDSEFAEALKQTGFRDEFRSYVLHAGYR
jgi:ATP-dependent Lhr-like helicase